MTTLTHEELVVLAATDTIHGLVAEGHLCSDYEPGALSGEAVEALAGFFSNGGEFEDGELLSAIVIIAAEMKIRSLSKMN